MDILDIKINKEKLKQLAKNSVLFSVSIEDLNDFLRLVDSIEENDNGAEKITFLMNKFNQEKDSVVGILKNI
ncbi:MAG: hypothetical protein EXS50_02840 [Candidatus Taylorbacteria bacterium]|nr:hypothetical protein [Candidatus Taylorbacteria bacterium]